MRHLPHALLLALVSSCSGARNSEIDRNLGQHDAGERDAAADADEPSEAEGDAAAEPAEADIPQDASAPSELDAAQAEDASVPDGDPSMLDASAGDAATPGAADATRADATPSDAAVSDAGPVQLVAPDAPFSAGIGGTWCGLAFDHVRASVWVIECFGATLNEYSTTGVLRSSIARPGESADDVDLDVAPGSFQLNGVAAAEGSVLLINGESGPAEVYGVDPADDASVPSSLASAFGNSHVVGGAYHIQRGSLFAVQDRVPGAGVGNTVAEIDVATGSLLRSFSTLPNFDVNYGDLDVCQSSGHLFLVSSNESSVGEFTPEGAFVAKHPLPTSVASLSGIGLDDATGNAWVAGTSRQVWRLVGLPCAAWAR